MHQGQEAGNSLWQELRYANIGSEGVKGLCTTVYFLLSRLGIDSALK